MLSCKFRVLSLAALIMGLSSCAHPNGETSNEYPVIDLSTKVLENGKVRASRQDEEAAALALIVAHHASVGESVRIGLLSLQIGESWTEFYNKTRTLELMIMAQLPKDAARLFSRRADRSLNGFEAEIRQEAELRRDGVVYVNLGDVELLSDGGLVCGYSASETSGAFRARELSVSADRKTVYCQTRGDFSGNPGSLDSILIYHLDKD